MKKVAIIMGSDSDSPVMQEAAKVLTEFGIEFEYTIISAHRTPERMYEFARTAHEQGYEVIIAGAGGAAHLPGMVAAISPLPVIGVPVQSKSLNGLDSLLSIVQMPGGVPVATVAINGAKNAGILAAQILATHDKELLQKVIEYKKKLENEVIEKTKTLNLSMPRELSFYERHKQELIKEGTDWKPINQVQLELIKIIEKITETLEALKETVDDDNLFADAKTIDTYVFDSYQTTVKLCSCLDCEMYILYMENAAIIRYNMIQLYNFIGSVKMFSEYKDEIIIEKDYLSILADEHKEFKETFIKWTAHFEKDDIEDEWNLF
jgi:5-(carboxyamino)imidazole ribonucleotide mutase